MDLLNNPTKPLSEHGRHQHLLRMMIFHIVGLESAVDHCLGALSSSIRYRFTSRIRSFIRIIWSSAESDSDEDCNPSKSIDITILDAQAFILSPTRELATQFQSVVLALGDYMNVQCQACVGSTSIGEDIKKLEYGQRVVSGIPGCVFDMIRRRSPWTRKIKMLVLGEADELLNKGFED